MTATTAASATVSDAGIEARSRLAWAVSDTLAVARRNLQSLARQPQAVVFATIQPVIFVLMFRYVFGGAIVVPGEEYVNFLMPGIFAQTVMFGAMGTAIGMAEDLRQGLIERFRSLPMARSAVLGGRTLSDLARNVFVVALMVVVGFLVGFRPQTNVAFFLAGVLLLLAFAFAISWVFAVVGLSAPNAEAAQAAAFPVLAPLVFASSAFVPVGSMPGWLQAFAEHQPVSVTVDALRGLMLGGPVASPLLQSIAWTAGILAVFVPLAVRRYRRAA